RLAPLLDGLPPLERFWRLEAAATWWAGVVQGDPVLLDMRGWLGPRLLLDRLDAEEWARFWITEASADALAVTRVRALTGYFLGLRKVGAGDPGDINHAGYSVGRD